MADTKNEDAQKVCYAFAICMHIRATKFGADTFWVVYVFHGSVIVMATNTVFQGHGPMQFHSLHMYLLVYFPFLGAIKPKKYTLISPVYFFFCIVWRLWGTRCYVCKACFLRWPRVYCQKRSCTHLWYNQSHAQWPWTVCREWDQWDKLQRNTVSRPITPRRPWQTTVDCCFKKEH